MSNEEDPIDLVLSKLCEIEKRLQALESKADDINISCKGMNDHISFVDSIYEKLRSPLTWILDKFSIKNSNREHISLPMPPTMSGTLADVSDSSDSDEDNIIVL